MLPAASMNALLRATLDALLDPARLVWTRQRPALGQEPDAQHVFLSTGSRDAALTPHPRMLSWKLPQWREKGLRSTTEAVLASAEMIDALAWPITLWLHDATLDSATAAVLLVHRKLHGAWPDGAPALCEYVSQWEQGQTENAGGYAQALASVYYASMQVFRGEAVGGPAPELLSLLVGALDAGLGLEGLQALPPALVPHRVARRLKADADLYEAELSRAWKVQLDLPVDQQAQAFRRIDALFLSSPQDVTVLKLLARPDAVHATYRRGFELMALHAPNEKNAWAQHTLSIAPESPGDLGDLALRLDALEGPTAPDGTPRVTGKPRFTFQPEALNGLADPWYSDGYAWTKRRCTIVAPPFAGTRLSREQIWETLWSRFHVGRNVHVTASRTIYARPFRSAQPLDPARLEALGWKRSALPELTAFLPSVSASFDGGDVTHLEQADGDATLRLALYPGNLVLAWIERVSTTPSTLFEVSTTQASLIDSPSLDARLAALADRLQPLERSRWQVYGAYRVNRARSTMLDGSRSVKGLFHALAAGEAPTLENLPSDAEDDAREVQVIREVEHWLTPRGGARVELRLDDTSEPPPLDQDFALFLLALGQRSTAFELTRRMGEIERSSRTSRWQRVSPGRNLRADVMLFTNSLWHARVSESPEVNARYDAWRDLHGMTQTVEALREQTTELDEYRKERFENLVGLMLFIFLPITIVSGFFSGMQFEDLELHRGWPWTTGGWTLFVIYTAVFSVLVYGAGLFLRLRGGRKR